MGGVGGIASGALICGAALLARCQDEAVAMIVDTMRTELAARARTLFVVGSYRIGKERAYLGAARALGWRVFCDADKRKVCAVPGVLMGSWETSTADRAMPTV